MLKNTLTTKEGKQTIILSYSKLVSREKSRWRTFTKCPCTSLWFVCSTDGHTRVDIRQQKHSFVQTFSAITAARVLSAGILQMKVMFSPSWPKKIWVRNTFSRCFCFILQGFTLQLRLVWEVLLPLLFPHCARIDYCNFVVFLHQLSNSLQWNHNSFLLLKTRP